MVREGLGLNEAAGTPTTATQERTAEPAPHNAAPVAPAERSPAKRAPASTRTRKQAAPEDLASSHAKATSAGVEEAPALPVAPTRQVAFERDTTETKISLRLTIEGGGRYTISTGIRFFDHMLELFTRHGAFDLELTCKGDLDVDQHHTVEDVGIALGEAFDRALGDKRGIMRAGYFLMPMDETLAIAALDMSGRVACKIKTKVDTKLVGDLQSELVEDFFDGFARGARANVHLKTMYGRSNHHKLEAIFKAFARALRVACSRDKQLGEMLPSTKGLL